MHLHEPCHSLQILLLCCTDCRERFFPIQQFVWPDSVMIFNLITLPPRTQMSDTHTHRVLTWATTLSSNSSSDAYWLSGKVLSHSAICSAETVGNKNIMIINHTIGYFRLFLFIVMYNLHVLLKYGLFPQADYMILHLKWHENSFHCLCWNNHKFGLVPYYYYYYLHNQSHAYVWASLQAHAQMNMLEYARIMSICVCIHETCMHTLTHTCACIHTHTRICTNTS